MAMRSFFLSSQSRKGQSLVEALVALSVLVTGFLGILTLLSQSYYLRRATADQLTATYLAAEGVEIARGLIYHDIFKSPSSPWGSCLPAGNYEIDFQTLTTSPYTCNSVSIPSYNAANPDKLYFDAGSGLYGYNNSFGNLSIPTSPVATNFSREVSVSYISTQEAVVQVKVFWKGNTYAIEDHFYNWHP